MHRQAQPSRAAAYEWKDWTDKECAAWYSREEGSQQLTPKQEAAKASVDLNDWPAEWQLGAAGCEQWLAEQGEQQAQIICVHLKADMCSSRCRDRAHLDNVCSYAISFPSRKDLFAFISKSTFAHSTTLVVL